MKYYLIWLAAINIFTFLLYFADKRQAKKHRRRISESALLFAAAFGGGLGAFTAMQLFHHKTKRFNFNVLIPLFFLMHVAVLVYFFFRRYS